MKPLYIQGIGCISPQKTFDTDYFFEEAIHYNTAKMYCIEPVYDSYFDPKTIRRMSRVLKFGVAAAKIAIQQSGISQYDLISTGTGFGCLQDSELFLKNIVESDEGVVSPTPFIQSTHNTVSGIIALQLKCHAPNNTFSQKGFSFESALLEALMFAEDEESSQHYLIGSFDEISDYSYALMARLNILKKEGVSTLEMLENKDGEGIFAGEGAAFFSLSKNKPPQSIATIQGVGLCYKPSNTNDLFTSLTTFLGANKFDITDIDTVVLGLSGDKKRDQLLHELNQQYLDKQNIVGFKHLSGEYMTASSFGLYLASKIIAQKNIPPSVLLKDCQRTPENVLLINNYKHYFSFSLVST
jgi:3-oxoacyl-[acyl-carrier-protein] synthase II